MKLARWLGIAALVAGTALGGTAAAQQQFFRIGTGGTAGTYYPVGGILANAISQPPKLVLTAVASNGSVANVNSIMGGSLESGFSQADVAYWAFTGTGIWEGKPKAADLRAIANLYPESIHLVARKGAGGGPAHLIGASDRGDPAARALEHAGEHVRAAAIGLDQEDDHVDP